MDKIARIRAEIERRREDILSKVHHYPIHRIELLDDLLSFLDTLSEEPDTPEFPETFEICLYDGRIPNNEKCTECSTTCSVRKEEPDKGLEEEIDRFEDWMETYNQSDYPTSFTTRDIARHFAEWQKSQMLKDAYVESRIVEDGRIELEGNPLPCLNPIILLPYPQFKPGDKVRIIIVKED